MEWPFLGREAEIAEIVALIQSGLGAILTGDAGVGKSRLLREAVQTSDLSAWGMVMALATPATRTVPLAPFATLIPTNPPLDRMRLFSEAIQNLARHRKRGRLILAIDDAHHLDEMSLALVSQVRASNAGVLLVTVRSNIEPTSPLAEALGPDIPRVNIGPLSADKSESLLQSVLGVVSAHLLDELWRLSLGNPLMLHELVEGAKEGSIVEVAGVWELAGTVSSNPRLRNVVQHRLESLPSAEVATLELIAFGGPIPLSFLIEAVGSDAISSLESHGYVAVNVDDVGAVASPAHPLYGEILASNLPISRRRAVAAKLLELAVSLGAESGIDPVRLALWQQEAGLEPILAVALRGAIVAMGRHDAALAETLARCAFVGPQAVEAAIVLGRALSYQTRYGEAEEVLASAVGGTEIGAELASVRAHNLAFGLKRVSDAAAILDEASRATKDLAMKGRLDAERGVISAIPGNFVETFKAARAVLENEASPGLARASAHVSLALAQAMTADCDGMEASVDAGLRAAREFVLDLPLAEDQILIMQVHSHLGAGRLTEALELSRRRTDVEGSDIMAATWLCQLGQVLDVASMLVDAAQALRRASELLKEADPFRLQMQALGSLVISLAQMGEPMPGFATEGLDASSSEPRIGSYVDRAKAWSLACEGRVEEAADLFQIGGERSLRGQHVIMASWAFHDCVRLGYPDTALEGLEECARRSHGAHMADAFLAHAVALSAADGEALMVVARQLADFGAPLLAAEAAADAAFLEMAVVNTVQAARAAARSEIWERRCQSPNTPALARRPRIVLRRELQIAMAAVGGRSSREIADEYFISVRTVDNHLGSVYRKLGVGGRDELVALLL